MSVRSFLGVALILAAVSGCSEQAPMERAEEFFRAGQWDQAIAACHKELADNPTNHTAHTIAGRSYAGRGEFDKAITEYDAAIRIAPEDPEAYHNRAIAYREQGDNQRASDDFRKARELDPAYATAYLYSPRMDPMAHVDAGAKDAKAEAAEEELPAEEDGLSLYSPESTPSTKQASSDSAAKQEEVLSDKRAKDLLEEPLDTRTQTEKLFGNIDVQAAPRPTKKSAKKPPTRFARLDEDEPKDEEQPARRESRPAKRERRAKPPSIGELNARALEQQRYAASINAGAGQDNLGGRPAAQGAGAPYSGVVSGPFPQQKMRPTGQQSGFDVLEPRTGYRAPYSALPHISSPGDPVYTPVVPPLVIP
jgi:tetratricopeptide (TPR) repeat protein